MIFPSSSGNPGGSSNCRTPYRKQVRRRRGCRTEAGGPAFTKGGSARPGTALILGGTGLGGDLVSEGGGPQGRLGPATLAGEMPSTPPARPGGKWRKGKGGEAAGAGARRAGGFAQLCNKFGIFFVLFFSPLKPLCVEEYDNQS